MAEKYISQFTGQEIDEKLAEVSGKYGHIEMRFDEQKAMYYMDCYATLKDFEDKNEPIESVLIPISTVQGDSYTATLRTSLSNTADIVVTEGKLEAPLNYRAIKITQIGNENAGFTGSVIVERSTDGSTWQQAGVIQNVLTPKEIEDTDTYQMVEIGQFLVQGSQKVRVRASYTYTNENGDEKTVTSSNVLVGNSVTRTQLRLVLLDNFEQAKKPKDTNGNNVPFSVNYTVYGSVQKTLYLKVTDAMSGASVTSTYGLDRGIDSVNQAFTSNIAMTHGVKKVEAWLEADNGLGNTIKSDVLINRFMVVVDETDTKPYLLLQNVDRTIDNFVKTELCQYAVYSNGTEKVNVSFLLTDYAEVGQTWKKEYYRLDTIVEPNKAYELNTTIEIEGEEEGGEQASYNTYFRVRRVNGTTETDFMLESTNERNYLVVVDNSEGFTPVAGATFLLNPKVRNNSEENPKRILNAKNNNAEVSSTWENFGFINDGWMTDEAGNKVLRIMAGSKLTINKNIWAQFLKQPNSSLTFEIDCAIRNATNLTDPIIAMLRVRQMRLRA